jgi:hypothetical protein
MVRGRVGHVLASMTNPVVLRGGSGSVVWVVGSQNGEWRECCGGADCLLQAQMGLFLLQQDLHLTSEPAKDRKLSDHG